MTSLSLLTPYLARELIESAMVLAFYRTRDMDKTKTSQVLFVSLRDKLISFDFSEIQIFQRIEYYLLIQSKQNEIWNCQKSLWLVC